MKHKILAWAVYFDGEKIDPTEIFKTKKRAKEYLNECGIWVNEKDKIIQVEIKSVKE